MTKQQYSDITDKLTSLYKVIDCSKCFGKIRRRFKETLELMDDISIVQDKQDIQGALNLFDGAPMDRDGAKEIVEKVKNKFENILRSSGQGFI